ncbi:MAG: hypothetical protein D6744_12740 [Planctomycetota bacterium]|nr:MAG: hypothetical protein D6744_12740 [Planctomycetota bacterium]
MNVVMQDRRADRSEPQRLRGLCAAALLLLFVGAAAEVRGGDWLSWRGPRDNGCAYEHAVVTSWSLETGEGVLWRRDFGGRTTPVIHGGRLYFNGPVGEGVGRRERVMGLDADSGETIWERTFNVFHTDIVENRVGWTSLAIDPETGNVYCHGTGGELFCWSRDGELIWKRSQTEELGRISGYGGRLMTPIIDENRLVISYLSSAWGALGKGAHRYYAFDKRTGELIWISTMPGKPLDTTYATPVVAVIGGRRLLICPAADGWVYGLLARTGEIVWRYQFSKRGLNVSPVVEGNRVYVAHSEENYTNTEMGAVACIDGARTGDITADGALWRIDGLTVGYSSPALANGRLYVVTNDADLYAIDAYDGRVIWEQNVGRVAKGSPAVTADGVIYFGEQNGVFEILRDAGDHAERLSTAEFARHDGYIDEIFGSPAIVDGRVYFMTRYNTICLGAAEGAATQVEPPPSADEQTARLDAANTESATGALEIAPCDVTLAPGETVRFRVRQFTPSTMGAARVLSGPGAAPDAAESLTWTAKGVNGRAEGNVFKAADENKYSAGVVSVTVGDQEASARVRIVPRLPIHETFDDLKQGPPPGWIAAGLRLEPFELEGERVLRKIADKARPSPPFMRLRTYATMPISGGYTVQADMRSEVKDARRRSYQPDMGLINSRYRFIVVGGDPKRGRAGSLRIESWSPLPRLRKDVEFTWKPDVWYTAKFEVRLRESASEGAPRTVAVCRAKVWERGTAEPDQWAIEVVDPFPNTEGSAGLYAYSTGTTAKSDGPLTYFDNFKVYKNE